ncbi:hypothetical protein GLW07_12450 [Bacillus hwajinpoensis]|uniref:Lipoyl-binding domain-containing protein n=1 Tax=Guptibacillus hwajinpoensis TaxID=208199 RepID=A0A845F008_9BACL|nr:hypothetical protein [Pseudalkalibacillus hwajinpoensis]
MKSYQEVQYEKDGIIKKFKADDGDIVEGGQVIGELE